MECENKTVVVPYQEQLHKKWCLFDEAGLDLSQNTGSTEELAGVERVIDLRTGGEKLQRLEKLEKLEKTSSEEARPEEEVEKKKEKREEEESVWGASAALLALRG